MSEEEIKEIIKDFLELREIHSSDSTRKSYLSIYQEAIQGLLDLYNKEKEKNKDLEYENWIMRTVDRQYIPKDKIRAKIEELKQGRKVKINDLDGKQKESTIIDIDKIEVLKELLEE